MNRTILATLGASVLALSACVSNEAPEPGPPVGACAAEAARSGVGRPYGAALAEDLRIAAGAREVRRLTPDTVTTMEFRGDRLNVVVDASDVVREVRCG